MRIKAVLKENNRDFYVGLVNGCEFVGNYWNGGFDSCLEHIYQFDTTIVVLEKKQIKTILWELIT